MQGACESATRCAGENGTQESINLVDSLMDAANGVVMITTLDKPRVELEISFMRIGLMTK